MAVDYPRRLIYYIRGSYARTFLARLLGIQAEAPTKDTHSAHPADESRPPPFLAGCNGAADRKPDQRVRTGIALEFKRDQPST